MTVAQDLAIGPFYLNNPELAWLLGGAALLRSKGNGAHRKQRETDDPHPSQPCHDDFLFGMRTLIFGPILGRRGNKGNANSLRATRYSNQRHGSRFRV